MNTYDHNAAVAIRHLAQDAVNDQLARIDDLETLIEETDDRVTTIQEDYVPVGQFAELESHVAELAEHLGSDGHKGALAFARTVRDRVERLETNTLPKLNDHQAEIERLNNLIENQAERIAQHGDRLDGQKRLWQSTSTDQANLAARLDWLEEIALTTATDAANLRIELDRLKQSAWSRFAEWFARTSTNAWSSLLGTRR